MKIFFCLLILGALLTIVSARESIQTCRAMFQADKDYMKQAYLNENKQSDYGSVSCDSWGCHNTSGCCYNGYYNQWGWGWGVWIFWLVFCFLILGIAGVVILAAAGPWYYGSQYREGCYYKCSQGTLVLVEKDNK